MLDNPVVDPKQWQQIYVFGKTSRLTLGPTDSPIQLMPEVLL
jgi:hypothetical protein